MSVETIAAFCFGSVVGWLTNRTLGKSALSSIAAVVGSIGGAAAAGAIGGGTSFAWYSIGLCCLFFTRLIVIRTMAQSTYECEWLGDGAGGTVATTDVIIVSKGSQLETISSPVRSILKPTLETARAVSKWLGRISNATIVLKAPPDTSSELDTVGEKESGIELKRERRFANATVRDLLDPRLAEETSLRPFELIKLQLDIGPRSAESHVGDTVSFPDDVIPQEDVNIDVMVSRTDFTVGDGTTVGSIVHGRFFLPRNGSAAIAPDGRKNLWFTLEAPFRTGTARCRIGYYYNNILLQSQLLTAPVGQSGKIEINTDFTLAGSITSVANFPKRERIGVLTNGDGTHQIVLRKRSEKLSDAGKTFAVREDDVGDVVDVIREALWDQKVTTRRRSKEQLVKDLFRLAKPGNNLWTLVPGDHPQMFGPVIHNPADYVIQVTRPTSSGFAFPWALIYEIPLDDDQKRWKLCKLVEDWDGKTPLVTSSQQCCPHGKHSENVICPFGFWGFRYSIDQLSSTEKEDSIFSIAAPDAWEFVIGQTQYDVDKAALAVHVKTLDATLRTAFPAAKVVEGRDKATIRQLLGRDRPLCTSTVMATGTPTRTRTPTWGSATRRKSSPPKSANGSRPGSLRAPSSGTRFGRWSSSTPAIRSTSSPRPYCRT